MGHYPNPPDSFPTPGTPEFTEAFGKYLLSLMQGLSAEHTETQVTNNVAMLMGCRVIVDGKEGQGQMIVGSGRMLKPFLATVLRELVLGYYKGEGNHNPSLDEFESSMAKIVAELAVTSVKMHRAMVDGGTTHSIHDSSRHGIRDSEINP